MGCVCTLYTILCEQCATSDFIIMMISPFHIFLMKTFKLNDVEIGLHFFVALVSFYKTIAFKNEFFSFSSFSSYIIEQLSSTKIIQT